MKFRRVMFFMLLTCLFAVPALAQDGEPVVYCPTAPLTGGAACSTLEEAVSRAGRPGTVILTGDVTASSLSLSGGEGLIIRSEAGQKHTVSSGTGAEHLFTVEGGNVYFENVSLNGEGLAGSTVRANAGTALNLVGSDLTGNTSTGALEASGATINIEGSSFAGNHSAGNGAAINAVDTAVTANGSAFGDNTANAGGALYLQGGELNLKDCSLSRNRSTFKFDSYDWRNDVKGEGGGAAFLKNVKTTLDNCTLDGNRAENHGGALYIREKNTTILTGGTRFTGNTAGVDGGGLFSIAYSEIILDDVTFQDGYAGRDGGALKTFGYIDLKSTTKGFLADSNEAYNTGGAFAVFGGSTFTMVNGTLTNNVSHYNGGAISSYTAEGSPVILNILSGNVSNNVNTGDSIVDEVDTTRLYSSGGIYVGTYCECYLPSTYMEGNVTDQEKFLDVVAEDKSEPLPVSNSIALCPNGSEDVQSDISLDIEDEDESSRPDILFIPLDNTGTEIVNEDRSLFLSPEDCYGRDYNWEDLEGRAFEGGAVPFNDEPVGFTMDKETSPISLFSASDKENAPLTITGNQTSAVYGAAGVMSNGSLDSGTPVNMVIIDKILREGETVEKGGTYQIGITIKASDELDYESGMSGDLVESNFRWDTWNVLVSSDGKTAEEKEIKSGEEFVVEVTCDGTTQTGWESHSPTGPSITGSGPGQIVITDVPARSTVELREIEDSNSQFIRWSHDGRVHTVFGSEEDKTNQQPPKSDFPDSIIHAVNSNSQTQGNKIEASFPSYYYARTTNGNSTPKQGFMRLENHNLSPETEPWQLWDVMWMEFEVENHSPDTKLVTYSPKLQKRFINYKDGTEKNYSFTISEETAAGREGYDFSGNHEIIAEANGDVVSGSPITFFKPGIYRFSIRENKPAEPEDNVYYDESVWTLEIETAEQDGQLVIKRADYEDLTPDSPDDYGADGDGDLFGNKAVFVNRYATPVTFTPKVKKDVAGTKTSADLFTFSIAEAEENLKGGCILPNPAVADVSGLGEVEFDSIIFIKPGVYNFTIREIDNGNTSYRYDKGIYNLSVEVSDPGGDGRLNLASYNYKRNEIVDSASFFSQIDLGHSIKRYAETGLDSSPKIEEVFSTEANLVATTYVDGEIPDESFCFEAEPVKGQKSKVSKAADLYEFPEILNYLQSEVKTVNFTDIEPPYGEETTDISYNRDGSVLFWKDDETKTAYISSGEEGVNVAIHSKTPHWCGYSLQRNFKTSVTAIDVSRLDFSQPDSCECLFKDALNLSTITGMEGKDLSNVRSMKEMFAGCRNLTDLSFLKEADVSNVTDMSHMFGSTAMSSTKAQFNKITYVPIGNWDVRNLKDCSYMFADNFVNLQTVDLSWWEPESLEKADNFIYSGTATVYAQDWTKYMKPEVAEKLPSKLRPKGQGGIFEDPIGERPERKPFEPIDPDAPVRSDLMLAGLSDLQKAEIPAFENWQTTNSAEAVDFGKVTFTEPGIYTYRVYEDAQGSPPGYIIDDTSYLVTYTVYAQGLYYSSEPEGSQFRIERKIEKERRGPNTLSTRIASLLGTDSPEYVDEIVFNNKTATLTLNPSVENKFVNQPEGNDESFTYKLEPDTETKDKPGYTLPASSPVTVMAQAGESVSFGNITFSKADDYTFLVTQEANDTEDVSYDTSEWQLKVKVAEAPEAATTGGLKIESVEAVDSVDNGKDDNLSGPEDIPPYDATNDYAHFINVYSPKARVMFVNTYSTGIGYEISVEKTFLNQPEGFEGSFTYKLEPDEATKLKEGYALPGESPVTISAKPGEPLSFGEIKFTEPGEYTFVIAEDDTGPIENVVYDTSKWTVTVTVVDGDDGLAIEDAVFNDSEDNGEHDDQPKGSAWADRKASFVNSYLVPARYAPVVRKDVSSSVTAPDETYSFILEEVNGPQDGVTMPETLTKSISGSGSVKFDDIVFEKPGTFEFLLYEQEGSVKGVGYDSTRYKLTVEVEDREGNNNLSVKNVDYQKI